MSPMAKKFMAHYFTWASFSPTYLKYTRVASHLLAHAWHDKMTYFIGIWAAHGFARYEFTGADADGWRPPDRFAALAADPATAAVTNAKCTYITQLRPQAWKEIVG